MVVREYKMFVAQVSIKKNRTLSTIQDVLTLVWQYFTYDKIEVSFGLWCGGDWVVANGGNNIKKGGAEYRNGKNQIIDP